MSEEFIDDICRVVGHATPDGVVCSRCLRGIPELVLQEVVNDFAGHKLTLQTVEEMKKKIIHSFTYYEISCDGLSVKANAYNGNISIELRSEGRIINCGTV